DIDRRVANRAAGPPAQLRFSSWFSIQIDIAVWRAQPIQIAANHLGGGAPACAVDDHWDGRRRGPQAIRRVARSKHGRSPPFADLCGFCWGSNAIERRE